MGQARRLVILFVAIIALAVGACGDKQTTLDTNAEPGRVYPETPAVDPTYPGPAADHPMTHAEAIVAARALGAAGGGKAQIATEQVPTAKAYARIVPYARLLEMESDGIANGDAKMSRNRRVWIVSIDVPVVIFGPPGSGGAANRIEHRGVQFVFDVASHRALPERGAGGMLVTAATDNKNI